MRDCIYLDHLLEVASSMSIDPLHFHHGIKSDQIILHISSFLFKKMLGNNPLIILSKTICTVTVSIAHMARVSELSHFINQFFSIL